MELLGGNFLAFPKATLRNIPGCTLLFFSMGYQSEAFGICPYILPQEAAAPWRQAGRV